MADDKKCDKCAVELRPRPGESNRDFERRRFCSQKCSNGARRYGLPAEALRGIPVTRPMSIDEIAEALAVSHVTVLRDIDVAMRKLRKNTTLRRLWRAS